MVVGIVGLAVLGQLFVYAEPGQNKNQEEKLIVKIEREQNPGKKARLQLRLAKIKMTEADEAYRAGNFTGGKALLQQYLDHVKESWATLQGADGDAGRYLGAFKELEISLREDDRFLEELRHRVPYPEDESIGAIEKESSGVHSQVLEAIFPAGVSRKERGKRSMPPRSWMPAKLCVVES